jgi:hypothetical protein
VLELRGDELGEVRVQRGEEVAVGIPAVLQDALVPGGARVADIRTGELPDDPVGGLDPPLHRGVDLGVLLEHLQPLGELPLRGDEAAVARQPRLLALLGEPVDAVGLRLGGVVFPQLHVGVRPVRELLEFGERGAVGGRRHHRAGGEVGTDADDVGRVDAGRPHRGGHGVPEDVDVVTGHLQRPVVAEARAATRQSLGEDRVRELEDGRAELPPVGDPDYHGPSGEGAVVDPDDQRVGGLCGGGLHGEVTSMRSAAGWHGRVSDCYR